MMLHTASEVVSFAKSLENRSAKFYEGLCQRYDGDTEGLLSFARENEKNVIQIERAYYGVITDAIEACFAFDMEPQKYTFEAALAENATYEDLLDTAVQIEERIAGFYSCAAAQSKSLMADVPRNFTMIAKKRSNRIAKLKSLANAGTKADAKKTRNAVPNV